MSDNVTLEFLGTQIERMREDIASLRDEIRVLSTIVLRHDNTLTEMLQQIRAMVAQHSRFNDRLRRLEERPAE
jgi:chromosome segregation ATPase